MEVSEKEERRLDDFAQVIRYLLLLDEKGFTKFKDRTFHLGELHEELQELAHYGYNVDD